MTSEDKIGLWGAISIGVGGMVGGGIFAVLGLAADLAKGGTPIAFLIAGAIALITSYSYVNLSKAFPDRGGTGRFINEGFGHGVFSGGVNNLLWISYIIMLSLYASAFGSYAPNLLSITDSRNLDTHIFSSAIIIVAIALNYYSIKVVDAIETWAVVVKLVILLAFIVIGAIGLYGNPNLQQLQITHWEAPLALVSAGMIIFVAYEGFELIANAVPDLEAPEKNVPRAFYISVVFVIALYLAISVITVGSLPFKEIASAQDYVMAEAAKPMLGQSGFVIITVAALISTFSAINATLYGGTQVSFQVAKDNELPHQFTSQLWNKPIGLMVISISTLVLVNSLKLESISSTGSIGFLLIFATVNLVGVTKSRSIGGSPIVAGFGVFLCLAALITLLVHNFETSKINLVIAASIIAMCFLGEFAYKRFTREARN